MLVSVWDLLKVYWDLGPPSASVSLGILVFVTAQNVRFVQLYRTPSCRYLHLSISSLYHG